MSNLTSSPVRLIEVSVSESGQRLDNFVLRHCRAVPKTRIYRAIRKGEVRINKKRTKVDSRVQAGDIVRIPPIKEHVVSSKRFPSGQLAKRLEQAIVLDDKYLLVLNKPTGLAVHGGSGIQIGMIEALRNLFPSQQYLELVHRLDRDTSGLVLVAKKASVLRELHDHLRAGRIDKKYFALTSGKWPRFKQLVTAPLEKVSSRSGERFVRVSSKGKSATTEFRIMERFSGATLVEATPVSGRTHQIRVHAMHAGHPVLGDIKYSDTTDDFLARKIGLERLFLHATELRFELSNQEYRLRSSLDYELESVLSNLRGSGNPQSEFS